MENTKFDGFCLKISDAFVDFVNNITAKAIKIDKKFFAKKSFNIVMIIIIAVSSFALMLYFNSKMSYLADDYCYKFVFADSVMETTDKRIESFYDIITSMKAHYYHMNGRLITHTLVSAMLMLDKSVFNVINSLMYVLFTFAIYFNCVGKNFRQHNFLLYLIINLSIWTFEGAQWSSTTVWLTGSINYMWNSTFRLLCLLPFRFYADNGKEKLPILKSIVMFFAGIVVGSTSENMSGALFGMVILYIIYFRIKKYHFRPFFVTTIAGLIPSYIFMITAPGNTERTQFVYEHNLASSFKQRLLCIPGNTLLRLTVFFVVAVIFIIALRNKRVKEQKEKYAFTFIYFSGAIAATLAMFASPQFPDRAWFGIIIACITAVGCLIAQIDNTVDLFRRVFVVAIAGWTVFCMAQFVYAAKASNLDYSANENQIEQIEIQKNAGETDIVIDIVTGTDEHSSFCGLYNITYDSEYWLNKAMAKYYGVNTITAKK